MNGKLFYVGLLLLCVYAFFSCERVEFPSGNPQDDSFLTEPEEKPQRPPGVGLQGDGSEQNPATVADIIFYDSCFQERPYFVSGYVVGYVVRSIKNAFFQASDAVSSNILLADNPKEKRVAYCIPVELKTDKWRKAVSLVYNPEKLHHKVRLRGMVQTYFGVSGLRSVDRAAWLEDTTDPENPEGGTDPEDPEGGTDPEKPCFKVGLNGMILEKVENLSRVSDGSRCLLGTAISFTGGKFVSSSVEYGKNTDYRISLSSYWYHDALKTVNGIFPAVFKLVRDGGVWYIMDELSGAFLAYDVRGDASSTSWLPLYTLSPDELDKNYKAGFKLEIVDSHVQLVTSDVIKYSSSSDIHCLLRHNESLGIFKLNYRDKGDTVFLYLLQ